MARDIVSRAVVPEEIAHKPKVNAARSLPSGIVKATGKGQSSKNGVLRRETSALSADRRLKLLGHQLKCYSRVRRQAHAGRYAQTRIDFGEI